MSALRPGYQQTEVGLIPEDWAPASLRSCCDILTGFPFPSASFASAGARLIRGSNVKRDEIDWSDNIAQYWPADAVGLSRYRLREGDIVIAMDGALVGRSFAEIAAKDLPALLVQRVARLRSKGCHQRYVSFCIRNDKFGRHCDDLKTTTAIPHISPSDIKSFTIALPSSDGEQQAIAEVLGDADALIAGLEALIAKKRDIKQSAMQELLTGHRRISGFESEWAAVTVGQVYDFKNGLNKSKAYFGHGTPIINYMDVYRAPGLRHYHLAGMVTVTNDEIRAYGAQKGDVFFTRTSETQDEIGIAAVLLDDVPDSVFSGFLLRGRPKSNQIEPMFAKYCFAARHVRQQIISRSSYTTRALTNGKSLSLVELHLPPTDEQRAIAAVLTDMDAEIAALEDKLAKARAMKQGMMQVLLTGEIRLI